MYSGPLSTRIASGLPRHWINQFSVRTTRSDGNEKSTSIAKPSRLKSSRIFNVLNERPSANWSAMKSIDQTRLGASGYSQRLWLFSFQPFAWFNAHIELQLPVNAVNTFVVPFVKPRTLRKYKKHRPKPQARLTLVRPNSQSAIFSFSSLNLG